LIENRAVEHSLRHQAGEVSHICVGNVQITQRVEEQPRKPIRIPFTLGKLWARLGNGQHINRKLFLVVVKGELVALDKQLLQHAFPLLVVGRPPTIRLGIDIEFIRRGPGRCTYDLFGLDPVGKRAARVLLALGKSEPAAQYGVFRASCTRFARPP
jgi:hypothetical protein